MESFEIIARILRADKDTLKNIDAKMSQATGMTGVLDKIVEENNALIRNRLDILGLGHNIDAKEVYDALISKIEADDAKLFEMMGRPITTNPKDSYNILVKARSVANPPFGFFMKLDKAAELLKKEPPKEIMAALGYSSVDEMLSKEDIMEIYAALRFIEGAEWLNNVFFKQYETLTPDDFEFREVAVKALSLRWVELSGNFIKKKRHNLSHLKELGFIFTLPMPLGISGELLRTFSLMLHYYNEVAFYSYMFAMYAEYEPQNFAMRLISLLRGDVIDNRVAPSEKAEWYVIQRYLAKDDENDWRLFEPHINPEALHWRKAEKELNTLPIDFSFWQDLGWVGDDFKTNTGIDVLVSFNLVDTVMSLVKQKDLVKYLYHYQEAMWNKIFSEYMGEDQMELAMKKNLIRGWLEI